MESPRNPVDDLFPRMVEGFVLYRSLMLLMRANAQEFWAQEGDDVTFTDASFAELFKHEHHKEVVRMMCFQGVLAKKDGKYVLHPLFAKALANHECRLTYQLYDDILTRQSYHFADIVAKADVSSIKALTGESNFYASKVEQQVNWNNFMNYQSANFIPTFAKLMKFRENATLLDIACNHGENACLYYAPECPSLQVALVDLPVKRESATEYVAEKGLSDTIKFHERDVDVFNPDEKIGQYDFCTCTHFCTMFNVEELERLFLTAFRQLNPGGRFGIMHKCFDGEETPANEAAYQNAVGTLFFFSSTMGKGSQNSLEWYRSTLLKVGFESVEIQRVNALTQIEHEPWATIEFAFIATKAQ